MAEEHIHGDGRTCESLMSEVLKEYEKELALPKTRPIPQVIIAPVGLIGTGKTTVSKLLEKELPILRIEGDAIRRLLRARGEREHSHEMRKRVGLKYFKEGYSILFDSDGATGALEDDYRKYVDDGLKIVWLHIKAPEEIVIERLKNRPPDPIFPEAPRAIDGYFRRKRLHENLTKSFTYTFDTSLPIEPQIREAIPLIKKTAGWA